MRTLGLLASLLLLGSCGTAGGEDHIDAGPHPVNQEARCPVTGPVVGQLGTAVHLVAKGRCAGRLVARSATGSVIQSPPQPKALGLVATGSREATLKDGTRLLVLRGNVARRGGYTPWLVTADKGGISLLESHGESVLPFVATDGGGQPMTATCTADGFAVWTATAHVPAGVVLAWDVHRTSYQLVGGQARVTESKDVATSVADPTMRKRMPQLFEQGQELSDC